MPSQGTSTFDLFALRFHFAAQRAVRFPAGETANLIRGQLGKILYRRDPTAYARFFAPVADRDAPSGLHDPPRPFVLRVRHLDGALLDHFHVGVNLFGTDHAQFDAALIELARESLRADLVQIEGEDTLHLPLISPRTADRMLIHFLSPTELKNADRPEFGPLFARIRDRIGTLRALYGSGPLEIDFRAMGEHANAIRMTRCDIQNVDATRVSRSTGQHHSLGGFTGVAEYEGDLTEYIPYLEIAAYTGVGRQTVWGKGEISVETF